MSNPIHVSQPLYNFLPTEIEGFDCLVELSLEMRSSWNHTTNEMWRQPDPVLWDITHNPWVVLQTVSRDRIKRVLNDPGYPTGSLRLESPPSVYYWPEIVKLVA